MKIDNPSSTSPILAVRRIMNTLLSQRSKELEKNSQEKTVRGKRLRSHTGLNITDDDFILLKMRENEDKKRIKHKHSLKHTSAVVMNNSTTTTTTKRRGRPSKRNHLKPSPLNSNDAQTDASIRSLDAVIDMANSILDSNDSDSMFY